MTSRSASEQSTRMGSPLTARVDRPAARPASKSGTEKPRGSKGARRMGPENAQGQVADLAAGTPHASKWYVQCWSGDRHPVRERAVGCTRCQRPTFDHHAICVSCRSVEIDERRT